VVEDHRELVEVGEHLVVGRDVGLERRRLQGSEMRIGVDTTGDVLRLLECFGRKVGCARVVSRWLGASWMAAELCRGLGRKVAIEGLVRRVDQHQSGDQLGTGPGRQLCQQPAPAVAHDDTGSIAGGFEHGDQVAELQFQGKRSRLAHPVPGPVVRNDPEVRRQLLEHRRERGDGRHRSGLQDDRRAALVGLDPAQPPTVAMQPPTYDGSIDECRERSGQGILLRPLRDWLPMHSGRHLPIPVGRRRP